MELLHSPISKLVRTRGFDRALHEPQKPCIKDVPQKMRWLHFREVVSQLAFCSHPPKRILKAFGLRIEFKSRLFQAIDVAARTRSADRTESTPLPRAHD